MYAGTIACFRKSSGRPQVDLSFPCLQTILVCMRRCGVSADGTLSEVSNLAEQEDIRF